MPRRKGPAGKDPPACSPVEPVDGPAVVSIVGASVPRAVVRIKAAYLVDVFAR